MYGEVAFHSAVIGALASLLLSVLWPVPVTVDRRAKAKSDAYLVRRANAQASDSWRALIRTRARIVPTHKAYVVKAWVDYLQTALTPHPVFDAATCWSRA